MSNNFAYVSDRSIGELLDQYGVFADAMDCLITCVDSTSDVVGALRLVLQGHDFETHGSFVVLRGRKLIEMYQHLLPGFDEIYYFKTGRWCGADPSLWARSFTSERVKFTDSIPKELQHIMRISGALRYTSDGDGLNLIAESEQVLSRAIQATHNS